MADGAILAHIAGGGGGGLEEIALAVGIIALGVAFLTQGQLDRKVSLLIVVVGATLLVGSFTFLRNLGGGETIAVGEQTYEVSELQGAVTGICQAAEQAPEDFEEAQITFLNSAHLQLHAIASGIEDDDRALAADLLEAKNRVEEDITSKVDGEVLADDLLTLGEVTRSSLQTLSISAPSC